MEYDKWMPIYDQISNDLDLDPEEDARSARVLSALMEENGKIHDRGETLMEVERKVGGRRAYVFGAGPDLEEELSRLITEKEGAGEWIAGRTGDDVVISADGATSILMSSGLVPDVIVSDLDGNVEDQISCLDSGSSMFVHAHGDNLNAIREVAPRLHGNVIGTTQVDPSSGGNLDNFGGFSDGDRAAFIAQHFGATHIILLGFNFNEIGEKIGESGRRESLSADQRRIKFKKLAWASILLGVITRPQVRFYSQDFNLGRNLI